MTLPAAWPGHAATGRLFYEITVTNPGTKNQGWKGILYDRQGQPMVVEPGKRVNTRAGEFVSVACTRPWVPCGMIHMDTLNWMKTSESNIILDGATWAYKLYVEAEGSRSEAWRGELKHDDHDIIFGEVVRTPMGPFNDLGGSSWGLGGWFHVAWATPFKD